MSISVKHPPRFRDSRETAAPLVEAASIAVNQVLRIKNGETVLIITNPDHDVDLISKALYDAVIDARARPVLIYQPVKTQMDFAEDAVIAAMKAKPSVIISLSAEKMGKDRAGSAEPYTLNGGSWDHIFHLNLYGEKSCRAFWSPSVTLDSFIRTVPIDYAALERRCAAIKRALDRALKAHVRAPGGTDLVLGLRGRAAKLDNGRFENPGSSGNLPAGETFISPENNSANGRLVFDGSISLHDRDIIIAQPIDCRIEGGFVVDLSGGEEADALRATIELAKKNALDYEKEGKLPAGYGEIFARNAANIGELGIGLNPAAQVTGNMLEDEKAFKTCHFAIGHNYDDDAPALIHLDGLVLKPTISVYDENGQETIIERDGMLLPDFD